MDANLLSKVTALYNKINAEKLEKQQLKKLEKIAKSGKKGFTVFKTESNKLGVVLPDGITANGLNRFAVKNAETLEDFKNSVDKTIKL